MIVEPRKNAISGKKTENEKDNDKWKQNKVSGKNGTQKGGTIQEKKEGRKKSTKKGEQWMKKEPDRLLF